MTTGREQRPPLPERLRMPLRIGAVGFGYLVYRLLLPPVAAGIFAGAGSVIVAWSVIDRLTLWRRDREGLLQVGASVLGIGLIALGVYLHLR
ncbi:MAG: hypothetical protein ABR575_05545 [Actinomycetota bacterium]